MKALKDNRAELDVSTVITAVIAVVVGGILIAALLPTAVNNNNRYSAGSGSTGYTSIGGANVTNWTSVPGLGATYDTIPIMIALSGLFVFILIVIRLSKG